MTALTIVAPTDAQLGYIADLCAKQGLEPPCAIHSMQVSPATSARHTAHCGSVANGRMESHITFHHVVSRAQGGDDVAENIVPVCLGCHEKLTAHDAETVAALYLALTPDEHAYMMNPKGGKPR